MSFASGSDHQSSSSHTNDIDFLDILKNGIPTKLQWQVWQLTVDQLAKALSAKTSNRDVLPFAPGDVDFLNNHEFHIDQFGSEIKEACQKFVLRTLGVLLSSAGDDCRGIVELIFIHCPSSKLHFLERSDFDQAIMRLCWVPDHGSKNRLIEPDLLRECSDMFGVPKHLYSTQAYHAIDSPTTNRLEPDHRSLPGYYNMCQENYQHRDLSIGNILMVDETITTQSFEIANPNSVQQQILDLCKELGIKDQFNSQNTSPAVDFRTDKPLGFMNQTTNEQSDTEMILVPLLSGKILRTCLDKNFQILDGKNSIGISYPIQRPNFQAFLLGLKTFTRSTSTNTSANAYTTHSSTLLSLWFMDQRHANSNVAGAYCRFHVAYHRRGPEAARKILRVKELVHLENVKEGIVKLRIGP
ncbi:hypothetical protein F5878DRAFT_705607 [Lentinula raphanica]|uniref:Fungal-type protein kinase domain-containing protein n=1 Tax=Lentinula raphanica TaxID=153919 RepID=A0AA38PMC0_9AGAR|nr:hypothetical protein F5878DRAFT_705607 [Lentinula raphanica]